MDHNDPTAGDIETISNPKYLILADAAGLYSILHASLQPHS
jgi:hypothetical protein